MLKWYVGNVPLVLTIKQQVTNIYEGIQCMHEWERQRRDVWFIPYDNWDYFLSDYTYKYIYTHTYVYIYAYIYIWLSVWNF